MEARIRWQSQIHPLRARIGSRGWAVVQLFPGLEAGYVFLPSVQEDLELF